MKLSKNEIICLRPFLEPLLSSIINTKQASRELLSSSHLTQYNNYIPVTSRSELENLSTELPDSEEELIALIHQCKSIIAGPRGDTVLKSHSRTVAIMALIKSGIRQGIQDNTYILVNGISYPKDNKLSDSVIAAIYKEL